MKTTTSALQNWINHASCRRDLLVTALALAVLLLPTARAEDGAVGDGSSTAEGTDALGSLMTGVSNTAVGLSALFLNKGGSFNTAVGSGALSTNDADNNTAIGRLALNFNTIGADNTAVGFAALSRNEIGIQNTATGSRALENNTADNNTATGFEALNQNTTGTFNTATGVAALLNNISGNNNTATGLDALLDNTSGKNNTATGFEALGTNKIGANNTAEGYQALLHSTGSSNVAVGSGAGINLTTGSNNIDIGNAGVAGESAKIRIGKQGTQTGAFISGIYNVSEGGTIKPLYINSNGQLGTQPPASSRRFKEAIKPMDKSSEAILGLKPVTFHYKSDSEDTPQFGLIAEEVAKVNPNLVVRDDDGQIYTVRYDAINAMLLNEFLKEHSRVQAEESTITELNSANAEQKGAMSQLQHMVIQQQKQIEALTTHLQRVSDQLELINPSPQWVAENN